MKKIEMYNYKLIALAGTFDRLHKGHKYFLSQAFEYGNKVLVGLTSDHYVREKFKINPPAGGSKLKINVSKFIDRKKELESYLIKEGLINRAKIVKIDDVYGPAIEDNDIEALVVTNETMKGAQLVNKERERKQLGKLKIIKVPYIYADDKKLISSTRIRIGEIDRWGKVFAQLQITGRPINQNLRISLKKPLGKLLIGNHHNLKKIIPKLKELIGATHPTMIITVGDEVTKLLNEASIETHLAIIDYKVKRVKIYNSLSDLSFKSNFARGPLTKAVLTVRNPAGNITKSSVLSIKKALSLYVRSGDRSIIEVSGEEDLTALPSALLAPLGALVLYGQPEEGVVAIEVTEDKKQEIIRLISRHS